MSLAWYEARALRAPRVGWADAHVGEWTGDALRERLGRLDQSWRALKRDVESVPATAPAVRRPISEIAAALRARGIEVPEPGTWDEVRAALASVREAHASEAAASPIEWDASPSVWPAGSSEPSEADIGARLWSQITGEPAPGGDPLGAEWRRDFRATFQRWATFTADASSASIVQRWFGELEPEAERYRRELERLRGEFTTRSGRAPTGALPDEIPREPSTIERVTGGWLGGFGGGIGLSVGLAALAALVLFLARRG